MIEYYKCYGNSSIEKYVGYLKAYSRGIKHGYNEKESM